MVQSELMEVLGFHRVTPSTPNLLVKALDLWDSAWWDVVYKPSQGDCWWVQMCVS